MTLRTGKKKVEDQGELDLALNTQSRLLITKDQDECIRLWKIPDGSLVRTIRLPPSKTDMFGWKEVSSTWSLAQTDAT